MDVIVTRYIGIRGTAILAREYYDDLSKRYPEWLVKEASIFDESIEKYNDVEIVDSLNTEYTSQYTEFGVYEALFQAAKELKCGLRINVKDIPIKQETVEICEFTGVNPYALYSGLSMVVVADNGKEIVKQLEERNIPAFIIGYTTNDNDKLIINEDESGFLPHIRKDELKNKLGRKVYYERTDFSNTGKE